MEYITGNYKFEQYLQKYVNLSVDGVIKKFYVDVIGNTSHVQASAYIFGNKYAIEGLADEQYCGIPSSSSTTSSTTRIPTSTSSTTSSTTQSPCNQISAYFYPNTGYMTTCNGIVLAEILFNYQTPGIAYTSPSPACDLFTGTVYIGYSTFHFQDGILDSFGDCGTTLPPTTTTPVPTTTSSTTPPPTTLPPTTTTPVPTTTPPTTTPPTTTPHP
jgi:hypothetical protein